MNNPVAERIKQVRESYGWTQEQLAFRAGLQSSAISHFETGKRVPSLGNFIHIVCALGTTADFLLGLNGKENHDATE